jgi:release factor glutamine methyltransferase
MSFRKRILNLAHPILRRLTFWYLSKPRVVRFDAIRINVLPGVFHPGLFFSTKILLRHVIDKQIPLQGRQILELGAGSGLLSFYCAAQGARVTASDISKLAINNLKQNAEQNKLPISIVESDLFQEIDPNEFDIIFINPPYYPNDPVNENEMAWYCGSGFEYFKKLFDQLKAKRRKNNDVLMILSEDCNIPMLKSIAKQYNQSMNLLSTKQSWGEENYIYSIKSE